MAEPQAEPFQVALNHLRVRLQRGDLAPGARLAAVDLADELRLSTTPVGEPAEPAQTIHVAQVAGKLGHHLPVEQGRVLLGEAHALGQVLAPDQSGALLGLLAAQVVLGDVEGDAGEQGLGVAPVDAGLGEAEEGLLGQVLGDVAAEAAGEEGGHPGAVGAVEGADFSGPGTSACRGAADTRSRFRHPKLQKGAMVGRIWKIVICNIVI